VESAGTVTFVPLSGWWGTRGVTLVGQLASSQRLPVWSSVSRDYFRALGIPLISGRSFIDDDTRNSTPVAVISKTLARQLLPNQDPVGKRVNVDGLKAPVEIVGVVGDVHQLGLTSEIKEEIYLPFSQAPAPLMCFAIRTGSDPARLARAAEGAVWAVDKDQAVSFVMSMHELASESLAPQRIIAILLVIFAAMALLMAAVGIYGVISFSAAQRTHEFGVRVALGAGSADVLRLVVGQGLGAVGLGLVIGLIATFALTRFLSSILFGVRPSDPLILAIVSIVLAGAAVVASCVPARRAMKADPMAALRYE